MFKSRISALMATLLLLLSTLSPLAHAADQPPIQVKAKVVSVQAQQVTLSHQAIPALGWPAMTMPFTLATPQLAEGLKPGLAILATIRPVDGDSPVVTGWQPSH